MTSTRARPEGPLDELSDYDIIVSLEDIGRFDASAAYGTPAARWGDDHDVCGTTTLFRGVVYADGVKIDWTLWPANVPELIAEHGLTDNLDAGYKVLLDKDDATERWVQSPGGAPTYVAKARARNDLFFLRFVLDVDMTHTVLRRMLEWLIETSRGWDWKPGAYSRGIECELPPHLRGTRRFVRVIRANSCALPPGCQRRRRGARLHLSPAR